jgi:hypothetical protein
MTAIPMAEESGREYLARQGRVAAMAATVHPAGRTGSTEAGRPERVYESRSQTAESQGASGAEAPSCICEAREALDYSAGISEWMASRSTP